VIDATDKNTLIHFGPQGTSPQPICIVAEWLHRHTDPNRDVSVNTSMKLATKRATNKQIQQKQSRIPSKDHQT